MSKAVSLCAYHGCKGRPLKRAMVSWGARSGVARCALTPGYYLSRLGREGARAAQPQTVLLLSFRHIAERAD
jgi:hypothetical protein